jgi:hypothetical protein
MKSFSLLLAVGSMMVISCERHEFEGPDGTKQLSESHHGTAEHAEATEHEVSAEKPEHAAPKGEHKAEH